MSQISQIISVEKNLSCGEFEQFIEFYQNYAVFVLNLCGEKSVWRKNDKYVVWIFIPSLFWRRRPLHKFHQVGWLHKEAGHCHGGSHLGKTGLWKRRKYQHHRTFCLNKMCTKKHVANPKISVKRLKISTITFSRILHFCTIISGFVTYNLTCLFLDSGVVFHNNHL